MRYLRNLFLSGLLVLVPLAATLYIVFTIFHWADGLLGDYIEARLGVNLPGLGVLVTLAIILLTGLAATNILGRQFILYGESVLLRMPVARSIYGTVKQIMEAFVRNEQDAFKRVALIEYPRKGIYSLGLVTGVSRGEVQSRTQEEMVNVFVPTTPNPTSGYLLLVPRDQITFLDMSVEEGMRLIISGGVVTPAEGINGLPREGEEKA